MSAAFNDLVTHIQTIPVVSDYTVWSIWLPQRAQNASRYIVMKQIPGGASDEDIRSLTFDVFVISMVEEQQVQKIWDDATTIQNFLLQNNIAGQIITINSVADVSSPVYMEDNRVVSRFTVSVLYPSC